MIQIMLQNRLGGLIKFDDSFKEVMDLQGTCSMWGTPVATFSVNTHSRWQCFDTWNPTAFANLYTRLINSGGYFLTNLVTAFIDIPAKTGSFGGNYSDLDLVADIVLVKPGQNTAAEPGYSLKVYAGKFVAATSGAYTLYTTYAGFRVTSIANNFESYDIELNTGSYFMGSTADSGRFNACPDWPDVNSKLYLYFDGINLRFVMGCSGSSGWGYGDAVTFNGTTTISMVVNDDILKNVWQLTTSDTGLEDAAIDPEYGNFSTAGGYKPSFDDSSDTIPVPNKPSLGVTSTGFQNVYVVTAADIASIGSEIFPIPTAGTDVLSALNSLIDVQSSINLSNYVVDCRILPVEANHSAVNTNISIAGRTLNSTGKVVTDDYVDVDCGSVSIPERYGNFADYEPYTTAKLYLPFVGFVPVHIEFLKKLQVKYRFNVIDGSFVVYVLATSDKSELNESVVGQYAGCACVHIPFSGLDYANFNRQVAGSIVGTISGVVNTAAGLASGNLAQATKGGAGIISGISQGVSAKPDYQQSNSYTGSTSFMTVRTPYLLIARPEPQFSANYPKENGLPLNVKKTLSSCSGFTVCGDVIADGINCTDVEREMIVNELKAGVIL